MVCVWVCIRWYVFEFVFDGIYSSMYLMVYIRVCIWRWRFLHSNWYQPIILCECANRVCLCLRRRVCDYGTLPPKSPLKEYTSQIWRYKLNTFGPIVSFTKVKPPPFLPSLNSFPCCHILGLIRKGSSSFSFCMLCKMREPRKVNYRLCSTLKSSTSLTVCHDLLIGHFVLYYSMSFSLFYFSLSLKQRKNYY